MASALFALYVANFSHYNKVYGSLAGVIIFLIWMWLSNVAILLGAEFNAEIERGRAVAGGHPIDEEPFSELRDDRKLRRKEETAFAEPTNRRLPAPPSQASPVAACSRARLRFRFLRAGTGVPVNAAWTGSAASGGPKAQPSSPGSRAVRLRAPGGLRDGVLGQTVRGVAAMERVSCRAAPARRCTSLAPRPGRLMQACPVADCPGALAALACARSA